MPLVDALITAGGTPQPGDPLYVYTQGQPKALLPLAGQPMVQWILDALGGAQTIRRVVVVGLAEDAAPLTCLKPLAFLPNHGSMFANIVTGTQWAVGQDASTSHVLVVSSDIPTITSAIVNWNVETSLQTDHDGYYSVISRENMERRFPGSKRSYFRFKEGLYTAGDMNLFATRVIKHIPPQVQALTETRKDILKQAGIIGYGFLLRFVLGQVTVADAVRSISHRLGITGRALICPYAEAGMDVDKPAQYELIKRDLEKRQTDA